MFINLKKNKVFFIKKKLKKKYFFYSLICAKSRIKFKIKDNLLLIKVNNNISILKKKSDFINIKIIENKIFLYSESIKEINEFSKMLYAFCDPIHFL